MFLFLFFAYMILNIAKILNICPILLFFILSYDIIKKIYESYFRICLLTLEFFVKFLSL